MFSAPPSVTRAGTGVAEEAELEDEVHGDDHDREPARPSLSGKQAEPPRTSSDPQISHRPAPAREVDDEEAGSSGDEVLVQQGDQALKEVDPPTISIRMPAKPIHPAMLLVFISASFSERS